MTERTTLKLNIKPISSEKSTTNSKTSDKKSGVVEKTGKLPSKLQVTDNTNNSNVTSSNVVETENPLPSSKKHFLSSEEYSKLLQLVQEKYPTTFSSDQNSRMKILAIGIHRELIPNLGISSTLARRFLHKYCTTKSYKAARNVGADRYDLAGNIVGKVTDLEATKYEQKV